MKKPMIEKYELLEILHDVESDIFDDLHVGDVEANAAEYAFNILNRIKETVYDMPVHCDLSGWAGIPEPKGSRL